MKDIRFFEADGILLMTDSDYTNPELLEKVYKKGNFNLEDVKKVFRKHFNAYSAYLPDDVHWTVCPKCGGTGHFRTTNIDNDIHYSLCDMCFGKGGKFFDSKGNEIDAEKFFP